jgi:undecaprenyl-diphosphatase
MQSNKEKAAADFSKKRLKKRKYAEYIQDFTALGNPFLLLLVAFVALQGLPFAAFGLWARLLIGFFANEIICSGIKFFWHKPRPNGQQFDNPLDKIDAGSFPSIHASRISFVYSSLAYLHFLAFGTYYFAAVALVVVVVVGYSRVFLRKHFLEDVLAGYGFGSAMSALVWWLNW